MVEQCFSCLQRFRFASVPHHMVISGGCYRVPLRRIASSYIASRCVRILSCLWGSLDEDIQTAAAAQRGHDTLQHARPPLPAVVLVLAVRRALLVVGPRGVLLLLLVVGTLRAVGALRAIWSLRWWGPVSHVLLLVVAAVLGRVVASLRGVALLLLLLLLLAVPGGLRGLGPLACVVGRWGVC
ncbi:hypothetical protein F5883DRAFT_108339 [Diaporthe sp. PMI_573]|nr:hypothetical protein F5883DRAFT_108339 [Diaporthaceae sp. PMI_573]